MSKIKDIPSIKDITDTVNTLELIERLSESYPSLTTLFPKINKTNNLWAECKQQAEQLTKLADQFNECFSEVGWVIYESMNLDTVIVSIKILQKDGLEAAELYLAESYNEKVLNYGILRLAQHDDFQKRLRLIELAKEDYLNARYHACIPLLLSLLDGLANDISNHVGFFATGSVVTAWDSIAAHDTGLKVLQKIFGKKRNKTNLNPINIPFRNGILHGRELAFDNRIVAAKCWATLFALVDWANALNNVQPEPEKSMSINDLLLNHQKKQSEHLARMSAMEQWAPRSPDELQQILNCKSYKSLTTDSPEFFLITFLDNWSNKRFDSMAKSLSHYYSPYKNSYAGSTKKDFGPYKLNSYRLIEVTDITPSSTQIKLDICSQHGDGIATTTSVTISLTYRDEQRYPMMRGWAGGTWKIDQGGFSKLIDQD